MSERIRIERCHCGQCSDWWLVGIGKFVQGSGFSEAEAQLIADLLNERPADERHSASEPRAEVAQ